MMRCDAVGSRNIRWMTPASDGFFGRSMSCPHTPKSAAAGPGPGPGEQRTIYIFRPVEVDPENAPVREGKDEDIVGDLGGNKGGRDGELELDALDVEDGQRILG